MPTQAKYIFMASMDVEPGKEDLFNEVYDTEHIPSLLKVPFAMSIGGEEKKVAPEGPLYSALYEIDGPHVLISKEWAQAVEAGRWPGQVRPHTRNRRHALYKVR